MKKQLSNQTMKTTQTSLFRCLSQDIQSPIIPQSQTTPTQFQVPEVQFEEVKEEYMHVLDEQKHLSSIRRFDSLDSISHKRQKVDFAEKIIYIKWSQASQFCIFRDCEFIVVPERLDQYRKNRNLKRQKQRTRANKKALKYVRNIMLNTFEEAKYKVQSENDNEKYIKTILSERLFYPEANMVAEIMDLSYKNPISQLIKDFIGGEEKKTKNEEDKEDKEDEKEMDYYDDHENDIYDFSDDDFIPRMCYRDFGDDNRESYFGLGFKHDLPDKDEKVPVSIYMLGEKYRKSYSKPNSYLTVQYNNSNDNLFS